jgi:molecular chaperone GrpE (heat shock protein)
MGDPRNVAHAKKVTQEKHHKGDAAHSHPPGAKVPGVQEKQAVADESSAVKSAESAKPQQKPDAAKLEKSLTVLAKLKELEFHSRANIEKLAELSLTTEEELKQKAFAESIRRCLFRTGRVSVQDPRADRSLRSGVRAFKTGGINFGINCDAV